MWGILVFNILLFFFKDIFLIYFFFGILLFYLFNNISSSLFFSMLKEYLIIDKISLVFLMLNMVVLSSMFLSYQFLNEMSNSVFLMVVSLFMLISVNLCFLTTSWLLFYLFFELSVFPMLFLIIIWGFQPERMKATSYLLIYSIMGSLPLLGVIYYSSLMKNFNIYYLKFLSLNFDIYLKMMGKLVILLFWMLAFLMKTPMFGFHLWLPKAHVEAPVFGSMFLAAVLLKLGSYGFIRLNCFSKLVSSWFVNMLMIWVGFTLLISGLMCFNKNDLKSFMAYSSVVHMAMTLIGVCLISYKSLIGMMMISLGHGFVSSVMFYNSKIFYQMSGSRKLLLKKGVKILFPLLFFFWFCCCMAKCSIPPFLSLYGEILVSSSVMGKNNIILMFIFFSVFITGLYSMYLCLKVIHSSTLQMNLKNNIMYLNYFSNLFNIIPGFFFFFFFNYFF